MFQTVKEDVRHAMEGKHKKSFANLLVILVVDNGFQAVLLHRVAHWFFHHGLKLFAYLTNRISIMLTGVDISPSAEIGAGFAIGHGVGLVIGGGTRVGRHVLLMQGVTLGARGLNPEGDISMPTIGDRVVVSAGAKVLGGISVGASSVIAANSVLLESVPEGSVVAGIPGRIVANRQSPSTPIQESQ